MNDSNKRKAKFLGIPFGTACNRLRKIVLFGLLIKYGENKCFKCGKAIEVVEDLSLEHKLPWEGRDVKLFWDTENVTFSHRDCNRPHIYRGGVGSRKVGPEGTAWCHTCKVFHSVEEFHVDRGRWNGLQGKCKTFYAGRDRRKAIL